MNCSVYNYPVKALCNLRILSCTRQRERENTLVFLVRFRVTIVVTIIYLSVLLSLSAYRIGSYLRPHSATYQCVQTDFITSNVQLFNKDEKC